MKKKNAAGKQTPRKSDLTDRREVEERLRRSEERYRRIFENIQDIYYEVGIDGTILEISPSIENYSPFRREELIGKSINAFYADQTRRDSFLQAIMEHGSVHDFEIQLRDSGGSLFVFGETGKDKGGDRMKMQEIREIAQRWSVNARIGRSKQEIIREIQIREGFSPCFRTKEACDSDCLWKSDCLNMRA